MWEIEIIARASINFMWIVCNWLHISGVNIKLEDSNGTRFRQNMNCICLFSYQCHAWYIQAFPTLTMLYPGDEILEWFNNQLMGGIWSITSSFLQIGFKLMAKAWSLLFCVEFMVMMMIGGWLLHWCSNWLSKPTMLMTLFNDKLQSCLPFRCCCFLKIKNKDQQQYCRSRV